MAKSMEKISTKDEVEEATIEKKEVKSTDSDIEALKKQVELLQAMLIANSKIPVASQNDDGHIRSDRNIQVMSLTPNLLNLSTQGKGKGKVFRFYNYGDMKNIVYSDLSDILLNYQRFAENGVFYIFDKEVVKRHGLDFAYENILDKKAIDSFLDKDAKEIQTVFASLSKPQRDAVVTIIVKRIVDGDDVSSNKVNVIKELYGEDIFAMAEEMKNWESDVEELSK